MAAPGVRIYVDARDAGELARKFEALATGQLPFATAAALTDTAKTARLAVDRGLQKHFKVRNSGLGKAIAFTPADKRRPPIVAIVGTRPWADFLTAHALGGVKKTKSGARVAVPTLFVTRMRTSSGRVPKRLRPRDLRQRKDLVESAIAGGKIELRRGKGGARRNVQVFYSLVRQARIKKAWPFEAEVRGVVARDLASNWDRRLDQALRDGPAATGAHH